ncbi:MAG: chemotaxis protein, partial [Daejeonella sp.]|nr:chemotaxis protein [Daejeonella sp.]
MILQLISRLCESENRMHAAADMAAYFNCSNLLIFIEDTEIKTLLPAPGFPQTIPDGKAWFSFLDKTLDGGSHTGSLPFPNIDSIQSAVGISGPSHSVAVLIGGNPREADLLVLKEILPIITSLLKKEQEYTSAQIRTTLAEKTAAKAEKLTTTIDLIRVHLSEALIKQENDKKAIEELMKKKDEFMDMASHELKTPLTSMKAYFQVLQKMISKDADPMTINFIGKANLQVDKLTTLVNDLLDVSKIEAGQMLYNFSHHDLNDVIADVVSEVQIGSPMHKLVVENSVHAVVNSDRHRLEQVIGNFLSNAIKYSPNADKVIIKTSLNDQKVRITVKDFGIGIPADMQALVFDRFYRVQSSSQKFPGLGIGLYISAEIIKRHGGQVGVTSDTTGTEFYFDIPVVNMQPNEQVLTGPNAPNSCSSAS